MSATSVKERYRGYPAYRDSEVEWLGEVPEGWEVGRLKRTVESAKNGIWGEESVAETDPICIRVADFDRVTFTVIDQPDTRRRFGSSEFAKRSLQPGDLLLEKSGGGEKQLVGAVVLFDGVYTATCSNFVARMRSNDGYSPLFLRYLHATVYAARLNVLAIKQNTGIQNLDQDAYFGTVVPLPPLPEQCAIAAFLDRETARLDALIAKKERLLELLDEKRTALISQAVTKGLDPDVPLKDSGVEWLGEVPEGWDVVRTKFVARLRSGHTPSRQHPEYWTDCTIPWFGLADVWQIRAGAVEYVSETAELISKLGLDNSSARLLPEGTVILSRTASVGFSAIMGTDMATTQDFANWVCGLRIKSEYLLYVFRSMRSEFRRLIMGSTHQTIYMPDLGEFMAPVPPLDIQERIVGHIREETAKLHALRAKVQKAMDLLKEYRTALISAAVTGKIDVREEVAV